MNDRSTQEIASALQSLRQFFLLRVFEPRLGRSGWLRLSIALLILGGCQKKDTPSELRVGFGVPIVQLNPAIASDAMSSRLIQLYTEALVEKPEPSGAGLTSPNSASRDSAPIQASISKDFLTVDIKVLRPFRFHDGLVGEIKHISDLITFYRSHSPKLKKWLDQIDRMSIRENSVLSIHLKTPQWDFVELALSQIRILHPQSLTVPFPTIPLASGPAKLVEVTPNQITLTRHELHARPISYEKVTLRLIEDPTTRLLALKNNEVDIITPRLPIEVIQQGEQHPELHVFRQPSHIVQYLAFQFGQSGPINPSRFQTQIRDLRVRQALAHALDIPTLIQSKLGGYASPATSALAPFHPLKTPLHPMAYDPVLARKLLQQARAENLAFDLLSSTDPQINSIQEALIHYWREIGVRAQLRTMEWGQFYDRVNKGNFDAFSLQWVNVEDPEIYYRIFHSSQHPPGQNRGRYRNSTLDGLLEKLKTPLPPAELRKAVFAIETLVAQDLPYLFLWHPDTVFIARKTISNLKVSASESWRPLLYSRKSLAPSQ